MQAEPQRRQRLQVLSNSLRDSLGDALGPQLATCQNADFKLLPSSAAIVCLQVSDAATVLQLGQQLRQARIFASAVRPPTVPTSRLRLTVMATHTQAQIEHLVTALS